MALMVAVVPMATRTAQRAQINFHWVAALARARESILGQYAVKEEFHYRALLTRVVSMILVKPLFANNYLI
jgi:hypothetical protein